MPLYLLRDRSVVVAAVLQQYTAAPCSSCSIVVLHHRKSFLLPYLFLEATYFFCQSCNPWHRGSSRVEGMTEVAFAQDTEILGPRSFKKIINGYSHY